MNNDVQLFASPEDRSHRIDGGQEGAMTPHATSKSELVFNLPKYYPEDHELTKWMINQMRRRNGLHHLINFANAHPFILSAHFEVLDQPDKYVSTKEVSCFSAYSAKTVLFLTPLAMAIYFGCKSVIRILLDDSGARLQSRARSNVDINATCYAKRFKPKHGVFGYEDYFTTSPAVLALRREFYVGLNLLTVAGFNPHDRIRYVDHIASPSQKTYWTTDLMEYALRLMITRPGFDIIRLVQYLTYPGPSGKCSYDVMTYDAYVYNDMGNKTPVWFSLFRRVCRRGISPAYANCANRLIDVLEILEKLGFFKQDAMPHGPVAYNVGPGRCTMKRHQLPQRVSSSDIRLMPPPEAAEAMRAIAVDRDECFAFMVIWLNRLRNRCLTKPYQRLASILLAGLVDTQMLEDFILPPAQVDPKVTLWPQWMELGTGLAQQVPNTNWKSCQEEINIFSEDVFDSYALEPLQVNELRLELKKLAFVRGFMDEKMCGKLKEVKKTPTPATNPTQKPGNISISVGKTQAKAMTGLFTTDSHLVSDEAKQSGDTGINLSNTLSQSHSVVPRPRNASSDAFNQHTLEDQGDLKGHQSRAPRVVNRSNVNNNVASRPKTTMPTQDKKTVTRRRPRSVKTPSPKPVLVVVKQKNASLSAKDSSTLNNKSKPRPRWRI